MFSESWNGKRKTIPPWEDKRYALVLRRQGTGRDLHLAVRDHNLHHS